MSNHSDSSTSDNLSDDSNMDQQQTELRHRASSLPTNSQKKATDSTDQQPQSVVKAPGSSSSGSLTMSIITNLASIFSFPIKVFYDNLIRLFHFVWSLLPIDSRRYNTDPVGNVEKFIEDFRDKFGDQHPYFYRGSYGQALSDAKRDLKFLLVYLHNELHEDTGPFCREVLTHYEVINYLSRNSIIFWACSIDLPEGYRASLALRENTYPFLALVVLKNSHMTVVRKFEGKTTVERLLSQLQQGIEENEQSIRNSRLERQQRDMNQQIRRQQDEDYLKSLQADQEKERKRRAEQERIEREEREIRLQQEQEQDREQRLLKMREKVASELIAEPSRHIDGAIRLRVKFPNGRQIQRYFLKDQSIKHLFYFVFAQADCPVNFKLKTNFPVRELPCTHPTLEEPEPKCTNSPRAEPASFEQCSIGNNETLYILDLDA